MSDFGKIYERGPDSYLKKSGARIPVITFSGTDP